MCVPDLCVTKRGAEEEDDKVACARFVCDSVTERGAEEEEEKNDGIQKQKQEPHTKM